MSKMAVMVLYKPNNSFTMMVYVKICKEANTTAYVCLRGSNENSKFSFLHPPDM